MSALTIAIWLVAAINVALAVRAWRRATSAQRQLNLLERHLRAFERATQPAHPNDNENTNDKD